MVADGNKSVEELPPSLTQRGYSCLLASKDADITEQIIEHTPDLVLLGSNNHARIEELSRQIKRDKNLPVVAVVDAGTLKVADGHLNLIDDFVTRASHLDELDLRLQRLLRGQVVEEADQIKCGDLIIDMAKCEVSVAGRPIILTFKEYQLLKFLASSQGRVFTREVLLNRVWGYEYYGGDRTVDVHVKRLRSKIEDANHTFVETVRNIGYRFRVDS